VLKAEMFATFKISIGDPESVPAVPAEAVIRESDSATVWVQREPQVFQRRKVTLGAEQAECVQIRDGLKPGELVVGRGAVFVDNEWRQ
jgi:cobalt-zinc-cadmium efflux system membrane fusion protein